MKKKNVFIDLTVFQTLFYFRENEQLILINRHNFIVSIQTCVLSTRHTSLIVEDTAKLSIISLRKYKRKSALDTIDFRKII